MPLKREDVEQVTNDVLRALDLDAHTAHVSEVLTSGNAATLIWRVDLLVGQRQVASFSIFGADYEAPAEAELEVRARIQKALALCAVCREPSTITHRIPPLPDKQRLQIDCPSCGAYDINWHLADWFRKAGDGDYLRGRVGQLRRWLAQTRGTRETRPFVTYDWLQRLPKNDWTSISD